jgi:hypothetical protein
MIESILIYLLLGTASPVCIMHGMTCSGAQRDPNEAWGACWPTTFQSQGVPGRTLRFKQSLDAAIETPPVANQVPVYPWVFPRGAVRHAHCVIESLGPLVSVGT